MADLKTYIQQFAHLRRAPNAVFSAATMKRAPHKPILLLAVLDLVARGVITEWRFAVFAIGDLMRECWGSQIATQLSFRLQSI